MSIFKNEIERKIFNRMISVFGLDDISEKRFMNAIDNPEIVIPDELQGILTFMKLLILLLNMVIIIKTF